MRVRQIAQIIRLIHINFILIRHGLDEVVLATRLFAPLRFLAYLNPWYWTHNKDLPHEQRIRMALEELGPIFVKFGQMLSTRRDLLPEALANELALLQDRVPPFPGELAQKIVEKTYSQPLNTIFQEFNPSALASASIAQVHCAKLLDGTEVVIKILRPNIRKAISRDVDLLYTFARLLQRFSRDIQRLRPLEVIQEFERTLHDELDLMREAANASQLRRNFSNSPLLYIPEIYWHYTRQRVMVMERISGIPISNIDALRKHGIDLKKLAEQSVEIFFTQVIRDCFFHADMHPGNIFVATDNPSNPQYIAVDFGIMGTLGPKDQRYLAENLLAFFKRDYRRVAELHVESGWIPANTRVDEFEAAIRTVCEPIFERPLKDISFGQVLLKLFQTAKRFDMEVQPQLVLLQKTLLAVEGLGRQLYPELDLWNTAKPFLEKWLKQQVGAKAMIRKVRKLAPFWAEQAPDMPMLIYQSLQQLRQIEFNNRIKQDNVRREHSNRFVSRRRTFWLGAGLALLVSVGLNMGLSDYTTTAVPKLDWALAGVGIIALVFAFSSRRNKKWD